jgi:hypothetical protein
MVMVVMMEEPFTVGVEIPDNEDVDNGHRDHEPTDFLQ